MVKGKSKNNNKFEQKVDRKVALEFGKRRVCKIDSTMKYDGPSSARIIKTSKID